MRANAKLGIVLGSLLMATLTLIMVQCISPASSQPDSRGDAYANPKTCMQCHKNLYKSYAHTSHYNTSKLLTNHTLPPSSVADSSSFVFNDSLSVRVEKQADGYYQTAYWNNTKQQSARFDVVFGAGVKAQTFAYWQGNTLKQLPLSYFNQIHNWANSPGFPVQQANFDRSIVTRCFECHSSYAEKTFVQNGNLSVEQEYNKDALIYGIDCQRCHGPAAKHVAYHQQHPEQKEAKYMVKYDTLSRQEKIDMCAVCHSGSDKEMQITAFGFKPGDKLARFELPFSSGNGTPDVHGRQAPLLKMSKCYNNSAVMSCTTCHNSHQKESADLASFTQKCNTCHQAKTHNTCSIASKLDAVTATKCIECHMPAMPSKLINYRASAAKKFSSYYLHTHNIAVYPEQTKQILAFVKNTASID